MKFSLWPRLVGLLGGLSLSARAQETLYEHFNPPLAVNWHVLSDGSERGGDSVITARDDTETDALLLEGEVGSIEGANGPVGFALARSSWEPEASGAGMHVVLRAESTLNVDIVLQSSSLMEDAQGRSVTYQAPVALRPGEALGFDLDWEHFLPHTRGKLRPELPPLDPLSVVSMAVQVTRSAQDAPHAPLPFLIRLPRKQDAAGVFRQILSDSKK